MANHPNRNWRKRWQVDPATSTAVHLPTGMCVIFERGEDGWDGKPAEIPQALVENAAKDGGKEIARLMREAGDIYGEYLQKKRH